MNGMTNHEFVLSFSFGLVPYVLKMCAEFIEKHGIVDGIYRLSGITSNIQKLRWADFNTHHIKHTIVLHDGKCFL